MNAGRVELDVNGAVATLTLSSSDPMNVFDMRMRDGLIEALSAVADLPELAVAVIRSAGRHFGAGADLREFATEIDSFEARWIRRRRDPWQMLWDLPAVTIAAIHGVAMGSAFEIALLCDVRVCHPAARLALPETVLGMLPGAGGTQSLPRIVRPARALSLVARGSELSGLEAMGVGIVDRLSEAPGVEADAVAHRLASNPAAASAAARALRAAADQPLVEALATERRLAELAAGATGVRRWRSG